MSAPQVADSFEFGVLWCFPVRRIRFPDRPIQFPVRPLREFAGTGVVVPMAYRHWESLRGGAESDFASIFPRKREPAGRGDIPPRLHRVSDSPAVPGPFDRSTGDL